MDIHRCRFVPYPPQSINALAFSHTSNKSVKIPDTLRLALGRSSGDIEIWNPQNGSWSQETILRGGKDRTIESLVWIQDVLEDDDDIHSIQDGSLRLFSTGDSPAVTEWDMATGAPIRHADSNFGDIWCLAAQPRATIAEIAKDGSTNQFQLLAAGCVDGSIVLFTTEDSDLRFLRSLGKPSTKKRKVLSITWRDRRTVVAGYDDSSIRVYDIKKRTTERTMTLGKPAESSETYVWCVKCLEDGTIISGDSSGELKIWDARNYSLVQRLKSHEADILDIGTSASGDMIITVGVDRRTVAYKRILTDQDPRKQRWTKLMHRRFHQHDIKTIATFESKELSVMVSGGIDTVPIVAPLREWEDEYHRSLTNLPQKPQLSAAIEARLVLSWWGRELLIWHIRGRHHSQLDAEVSLLNDRDYELVSRIILKDDENITSAHISSSGKFVTVATVASVKFFQLRMSSKDGGRIVRTRPIDLPPSIAKFGARVVRFSPDGHWISVVRLSNLVVLAKISETQSIDQKPVISEKVVKLTRKPRKNATQRQESILGKYPQSITSLAFTADSRILATGDISGAVDAWVLEGHETEDNLAFPAPESKESSDESSDSDSEDDGNDDTVVNGQKWVRNPSGPNLPQLDSAITALTFRKPHQTASEYESNGNIGLHATRHNPNPVSHELPQDDARLIAVTASHQVVEFEVSGSRLSDWTRRNPSSCLPHDFTKVKDRVMDCFWDGSNGRERLWMYGPSWLFMLDMSQDLPAPEPIGRLGKYDVLEPLANAQKKRKHVANHERRKKLRNTGAGDEVHGHESYTGLGRHVQKFKAEIHDRQIVKMAEPTSPISEEDMDTSLRDSTLALIRRNADDEGSKQSTSGSDGSAKEGKSNGYEERPGWWLTFEYRSVFGIVPVGGSRHGVYEETSNGSESNLEVVVIERPVYDLDFPPSFDGGQEWET